jgi:eRF1 domain 2
VAEQTTQYFITNDRPNVAGLVLAGSADFKTELGQSDMFDQRLKAIILLTVDVSYGDDPWTIMLVPVDVPYGDKRRRAVRAQCPSSNPDVAGAPPVTGSRR